jgi:hypothetical protein
MLLASGWLAVRRRWLLRTWASRGAGVEHCLFLVRPNSNYESSCIQNFGCVCKLDSGLGRRLLFLPCVVGVHSVEPSVSHSNIQPARRNGKTGDSDRRMRHAVHCPCTGRRNSTLLSYHSTCSSSMKGIMDSVAPCRQCAFRRISDSERDGRLVLSWYLLLPPIHV